MQSILNLLYLVIIIDRMFVFPQNSDVLILTPKEMVFGGGTFENCLGHEVETS